MPTLVIMNPWTKSELKKAATELYPHQKQIDIIERFNNAGPTARFCLFYSSTEIKNFYATRDAKIYFNTTERMLTAFFDEKCRLRIDDISLWVIRRSDSQSSLSYIVEPISATIRYQLLSQLRQWKDEDRVKMMKRFSQVPGAAGMVGLLFEAYHQQRFARKIEIQLSQMFRAPNSRSHWHATFGQFLEASKLYEAWKKVPRTLLTLSITPSEQWPQIYDSGKSKLVLEENIYYVPSAENEVAIDSFIVHDGHLYMFQFAGGPQHSVNRSLLITLDRFSPLPPVTNQYLIFIVPKSLDKFSCPHSDNGFLHDHTPYVAQVEGPLR